MKATAPILGFCLLALLGGAWSASAADVAAGKELATVCSGCHGENGVSQTPLTPSLAGEPDDYIQWQLVYFRNSARKSDVMGPVAKSLENPVIRNLGAYYASLSPPAPQPAPSSDALAQAGAKLAVQQRCRSCHGDNYEGVGPAARLTGQREDVLLKALRDFKSGARVGSGVASMADVTFGLNDNDMQALAHYMATRQ
ncbi:MAG TPA: c-type cytochrome [Xanthobacteraceae bacterium]|nr:c-type cytochrome [Xanthobacteraceae bacterium]